MPRFFGNWIIGERLGKGGQGKVFLATHKDRPFEAPKALKIIKMEYLRNEKTAKMLNDELEIMEKHNHPNIIKFLERIPNER